MGLGRVAGMQLAQQALAALAALVRVAAQAVLVEHQLPVRAVLVAAAVAATLELRAVRAV